MITILSILCVIGIFGILAYHYASLKVWSLVGFILLLFISKFSGWGGTGLALLWLSVLILLSLLNHKPSRQKFLSQWALRIFQRLMPDISATERAALEAGTVTWEGQLFSGAPHWQDLLNQAKFTLSAEEREFIAGPVSQLCRMVDSWQVTHELTDLPKEAWDFLKKHQFFGMIIPKRYGGLAFSACAHSAVLGKLYGKSVSLGATVSVPNSLGPAELLLKYGTEAQKDYYLPKLAIGQEIPCFALTSPSAGSDAASMPDYGVVTHGEFAGKQVVGIRLNWDKRYITLAPIATVLGLAFKLYDPEGLIGEREDIGITCALIPVKTPGITIGRRHFPLNAAFLNGPTQGKDVFIPLDWIIGGVERVGQGWRMLMECLAAGRAISLPSGAMGGSKAAAMATGAYARIRQQFNRPIGFFEGLEAPLARIAGFTYLIDAAVAMTAVAIDEGDEPPVASAIVKYHTTELSRKVAIDAMDIQGGKGICLGPRNTLGRPYQFAPIGITVEGANILTRNMIIFGQGLLRCHPYLYNMVQTSILNDIDTFDRALFGYIGHIGSNKVRAWFLGLTSAYFVQTPRSTMRRQLQQCTRYSSALAFAADYCLLLLKGDLKRRERLSARLGDILSQLYLISAVIKRFHDDSSPQSDEPVIAWISEYCFYEIERSFNRIFTNLPNPYLAWILRLIVFPLGQQAKPPNDKLDHRLARLLLAPSAFRSRLTQGVYSEAVTENPIGMMEAALPHLISVEKTIKRILSAIRNKAITGHTFEEQVAAAVANDIITAKEAEKLRDAEVLRQDIIAVDDFAWEELARSE